MNRENWQEYKLNGVKFDMVLNTKRHVWGVYFGLYNEGPTLEFTKAKGEAVIKFIKELLRTEKERSHD